MKFDFFIHHQPYIWRRDGQELIGDAMNCEFWCPKAVTKSKSLLKVCPKAVNFFSTWKPNLNCVWRACENCMLGDWICAWRGSGFILCCLKAVKLKKWNHGCCSEWATLCLNIWYCGRTWNTESKKYSAISVRSRGEQMMHLILP